MTILKTFLNSIKDQNIHIIGVSGTEGSEIALFLHQNQIQNVTLHDFSTSDQFIQSIRKAQYGLKPNDLESRINQISLLPYSINFHKNYLKDIEQADLIYAPQSWNLYPQNKKLDSLQNKISTITELYLKLLPHNIIGVTGSNGKSTTTNMIHHILKYNKIQSYLTGNDRRAYPLLTKIKNLHKNDWIIMEISNRQLNQIQISPHIAVLLNITENHLDEYKNNLNQYIQSKSNIFNFQTKNDYCIYNLDNSLIKKLESNILSQKFPYKLKIQNNSLIVNNCSIPLNTLQIHGDHNYSNLSAAILATQLTGLSNDQIITACQNFQGIKDRQETISCIDQITYINDRQGTSVDATLQAVNTLPQPLILIFGGENKSMPLETLATAINQNCDVAIGIDSPFVQEIKPLLKNLIITSSTQEAFKIAHQKAKQPSTVVFSPACSYGPYFSAHPELNPSFNNFKEYMLNPPQ